MFVVSLNFDILDLDFFAQNRLIYAFQRNIIANKRMTKYFKWFSLAHKSRDANNKEEDFSQFDDDDVMVEVIKRIRKDKLEPEEYKFISDMPLYEAYYGNLQRELEEKAEKQVQTAEQKVHAEQQKVHAEQQKRLEEHQKLLKGIENLLRRGDTAASIADLLVRDIEEIEGFVAEIEANKG